MFKCYCKYVVLHTYLSHYILCVSFGSLLTAIVHLLPQINVPKNMRTALFCVVCPLPVFIMEVKGLVPFHQMPITANYTACSMMATQNLRRYEASL